MLPGLLIRSAMVMLLTSLVLSSCELEDKMLERAEDGMAQQEGEPMVLGRKLENPFSLTSMQRAYEALIQKDTTLVIGKCLIRPTHYYVRFLPSDDIAFDLLKNDTSLRLQDYPSDYEILKEGNYYHDPAIPDSQPTYQYATVALDYHFPNEIPYEILETLCLPQQADLSSRSARTTALPESFAETLEDEAFAITGNVAETAMIQSAEAINARSSSKWTPGGRVTVWDSRLNQYIPLAGVKVQARRWFDVEEAVTDDAGHYRMKNRFRHQVNYRIVWERNSFDIRSGSFGQAVLHGPKKKGDWNVTIERNTISFHYAHVFRAAIRYYHGDIGGLKRPSFRLKYSVFNKRGNHMARNIGNWSVFGINPNILIYRYSSLDGTENDSDEIFSMTCHETAHTTHMETMKGGAVQFLQVSEAIRESWAIGVEWYITQKEYKELGIVDYADATYNIKVNYPARYGFQFWNKKRNENLTSLFIDLVDRYNQKGQSFSGVSGTVTDPVAGYTFAGMESGFLKNVYGISSLSEQLKAHKPAEITEQQIDVLMKNF
jgi:hypothetical protein